MVVLFHVSWPNPISELRLVKNGYLMVDFFFVLSGFVICQSYARRITDANDLRRFVLLRFGRIYPLHFAVLLAFLALELIKYAGFHSSGLVYRNGAPFAVNNGWSFLVNALLLQPFGHFPIWTFNSVSWSIAVEFYAYLVFGFVVLWVRPLRRFVGVALLFTVVAGGILAWSGNAGLTTTEHTVQWSVFRCLMGFFLGTLMSSIFDRWQPRICGPSPALFWWTGAGTVALLAWKETGPSDFWVLPLFALIILAAAALPACPLRQALNCAPLRWLGRVSYSIYMLHALVIILLGRLVPVVGKVLQSGGSDPGTAWWGHSGSIGLVFLGLTLLLVLALAALTQPLIEVRCQRWIKALVARWLGP